MNSDVQKSVNAKTNYFDEYLIVPDGLRPEVNAFCAEVVALGEQCADFNAFENRFASEGLSEKFVALICQCAQKKSPQTKEQRRESLKAAKSMMRENRKETAEYFADSVLTSARVEAEGAHPEGKSRAHDRKRHHGRLHKGKERHRRWHQPFRIPFE